MKTQTSAFAALAFAVAAYAYPSYAMTPTASQITSEIECQRALKDTLEARTTNPEIGDKSAKTFEQLIERATQLCADKDYVGAAHVLNDARGMVASE